MLDRALAFARGPSEVDVTVGARAPRGANDPRQLGRDERIRIAARSERLRQNAVRRALAAPARQKKKLLADWLERDQALNTGHGEAAWTPDAPRIPADGAHPDLPRRERNERRLAMRCERQRAAVGRTGDLRLDRAEPARTVFHRRDGASYPAPRRALAARRARDEEQDRDGP
jgi:hypothetical protein